MLHRLFFVFPYSSVFGPLECDQYIVPVTFDSPLKFNSTEMVQLPFRKMNPLTMQLDVMSTSVSACNNKERLNLPQYCQMLPAFVFPNIIQKTTFHSRYFLSSKSYSIKNYSPHKSGTNFLNYENNFQVNSCTFPKTELAYFCFLEG